MRNIKKAEVLQAIQAFTIYNQLVTSLGLEVFNPKEPVDLESEIYKEQVNEFRVALERTREALDKLQDTTLV